MSVATALGLFDLTVVGSVSLVITLILWWLSRQEPDYAVLRHIRVLMVVVTVNVVVFGAVFVNNDQPHPPISPEATKLLTRTAVALYLIPALYWLRMYLPRLLRGNGNGNGGPA